MEDRDLIRRIDKNHYKINSIDTILIDETSDDTPMVSVTMITYNHQDFIVEAIEGVLMQQTNFKFVLVIGEDCGTDQTRQIVLEYQKKYPNKIILKLPEKNLGIMKNSMSNKMFCQGRYIAECEGDDYWIDPYKLQKQVDFLEANPDFVIHSGVAKILKDKFVSEELIGYGIKEKEFIIEDFYSQNNLVTCTVMFRNCVHSFPEKYQEVVFGDWYLYVHLLHKVKSKAYRSTEIFSVYRIHNNGLMSSLNVLQNIKAQIQQITSIHHYLHLGFSKEIKRILDNFFLTKYRLEIEEGQFANALKTFVNHIKYRNKDVPFRKYISALKRQSIFKI